MADELILPTLYAEKREGRLRLSYAARVDKRESVVLTWNDALHLRNWLTARLDEIAISKEKYTDPLDIDKR